jgi:2-dehydro-3-deoxyphosphooctonate aldolase (KDO 8-P synthase)
MQNVLVDNVRIGPKEPLTIIAGPCVAESLDLCLEIGQTLRDRCAELGLNYIFKASYDKANRSSITSTRGPGLDQGLDLLRQVKEQLGVPATTDVHEPAHAAPTASAVDLLQIPAFLCRQTDLLQAAAATGKPVNVKKGQFMSPSEMGNVADKLRQSAPQESTQNGGVILTERGTFFGYHRLVNDFVGVADLMDLGWPVCFDVTHSTQQPGMGDKGKTTGGRPGRAPLLARCAVVAGVQALFIETHPDPARAQSDAATMLPLSRTVSLLAELAELHRTVAALETGSD